MRTIILRFDTKDELINLIERVKSKLGNSMASVARTALYEYCKRMETEWNQKK